MLRGLVPLLLLFPLAGCATPLMKAVKKNDMALVKSLVEQGADIHAKKDWIDMSGALRSTALHAAAWYRRDDMVRYLIKKGAKLNSMSAMKLTPLHFAAWRGHRGIVKILLEAGADPLMEDFEGKVPADYAKSYQHRGIERALRAAMGERTSPDQTRAAVQGGGPRRPRKKAIRSDVDTPSYQSEERPDDFAIVIGIDGYKNLPNAQFAERDAKAVAAHMRALGVPQRHIIHLGGADASGSSIKKYLHTWLPRNVKPTSRVFFYFSGHGAPDVETGAAYIVPHDGDPAFLEDTAYPIKQLYARLNTLKAKEIFVILDACFSGAGGRSVLAKGARPLVAKVNVGESAAGRISILTAASANQITTTLEEKSHGMFTYYFLKGLNGAAKDKKGRITVKSLYRYLKPKVQDDARLQNREQTPTVSYKTNITIR